MSHLFAKINLIYRQITIIFFADILLIFKFNLIIIIIIRAIKIIILFTVLFKIYLFLFMNCQFY